MKKTLIILLCLVMSNLYSQNTIQGSVKDVETNRSIAFATIYLAQLEKGTNTNKSGAFIISNLPSGNYKILISIIGYETYSQTIKIPNTELLNITLKPSAIEMEEVIISTPFHKLQSENVMKVEQKKIADLKANGATTLAEGIANIAGVETISTGLSIGKPVIRGLSSNRVLVYTQGVRLENQQFGGEHGLGINDAGIESVEVIKGPASLLYGSDALGGVLYINPERFALQNKSAGDINVSYFTNTLGYNTNAGYKVSGDKIKFLFRGSIAEHSDYKTKKYRVTNTRFREQDFKAGIGYQIRQFKTELRYNANVSKLGLPESIGEQNTHKTPLLPYQKIDNHVFSLKTKFFFNASNLDFNFGYIYNNRREFEEEHHESENETHEEESTEHLNPALQMKLKTFNYDVKYNLPELGKFETIVGVQGMNQINTNYGEEQLIPNAITNDFGVLVTSHIHFKDVDVQLGVRYDNRSINSIINKNYNSFNGAFGIKTDIFKKVTARINLATGFRAPNLAELTSNGTHEGTNRYEIGNSNLTNEQNFQSDLSLEYKNEHIEVFANGFYNTISDYIFLTPNGDFIDSNPVYTYVQNNTKLYGGEIGLHLHPHPLDWLHLETNFQTVTGKQGNGDFLPLIPANKLSNTIRLEFENKWIKRGYAFFNLHTTFSQNKTSLFETKTNGYSLLGTGFGGVFKIFKSECSVSISANNLTNKKYINHLSRLKLDSINNIGRNINVSFKYAL